MLLPANCVAQIGYFGFGFHAMFTHISNVQCVKTTPFCALSLKSTPIYITRCHVRDILIQIINANRSPVVILHDFVIVPCATFTDYLFIGCVWVAYSNCSQYLMSNRITVYHQSRRYWLYTMKGSLSSIKTYLICFRITGVVWNYLELFLKTCLS